MTAPQTLANVYPPDPVTPAGQFMMLSGKYPAMWIDSPNGNLRFHILGGQAPWPGLQDGIVCVSFKSYDPPFDNLFSQGAHQDGVTYNDTVYGPTEFDYVLKTSSQTLEGARKAFVDWLDSWDPKQLCKQTRFTETDGHWWCYVRKAKPMTDELTIRKRGQKMTWTAQNDATFWQSVPSVCTFAAEYASNSDDFERTSTTDLGAGWSQLYSGSGGLCATPNGHDMKLQSSGNAVRSVINTRIGFAAATDYYVVTEKHATFMQAPLGGAAYNDVWARTNSDGEYDGNGVRARFAWDSCTVSKFVNGTETVLWSTPTVYLNTSPPSVSLQVGTDDGPRRYIPMVNGKALGTAIDNGFDSPIGPQYRGAGNGMVCGTRTGGGQTLPSNVASWGAQDNLAVTQRGFQTLTNRGDQAGWASHLCYGPGTFGFGDGPGSTDMITLGPLEAGQMVLVTTLPRLRSVVDVTPNPVSASSANESIFQVIENGLIDLATFNIAGLLSEFENLFGRRAPQTVLYSLLSGRFSNPIPPKPEGVEPVESHIAVSIKGGSVDSKVISSVTPFKRMLTQ